MGVFIRMGERAITPEGGEARRILNKTGSASVKGTVVGISTVTDESFVVAPANSPQQIGVVYESGVADGSYCWVVTDGRAQVLLKDSTSSTRGNFVKVSDDTAGRADATLSDPPAGDTGALEDHMTEVGHALESKSGGTNVLCFIEIHRN